MPDQELPEQPEQLERSDQPVALVELEEMDGQEQWETVVMKEAEQVQHMLLCFGILRVEHQTEHQQLPQKLLTEVQEMEEKAEPVVLVATTMRMVAMEVAEGQVVMEQQVGFLQRILAVGGIADGIPVWKDLMVIPEQ